MSINYQITKFFQDCPLLSIFGRNSCCGSAHRVSFFSPFSDEIEHHISGNLTVFWIYPWLYLKSGYIPGYIYFDISKNRLYPQLYPLPPDISKNGYGSIYPNQWIYCGYFHERYIQNQSDIPSIYLF